MTIDSLTPAQEHMRDVYRRRYFNLGWSTAPSDRIAAEEAITGLYKVYGLGRPKFVWFDSPMAAVRCLAASGQQRQTLSGADGQLDAFWVAYYTYCRTLKLGIFDPSVAHQLGKTPDERVQAVLDMGDNMVEYMNAHDSSMYSDTDDAQLRYWDKLVHSTGPCFPYAGYCLMTERPEIASYDEREMLHGEFAPAIQYRICPVEMVEYDKKGKRTSYFCKEYDVNTDKGLKKNVPVPVKKLTELAVTKYMKAHPAWKVTSWKPSEDSRAPEKVYAVNGVLIEEDGELIVERPWDMTYEYIESLKNSDIKTIASMRWCFDKKDSAGDYVGFGGRRYAEHADIAEVELAKKEGRKPKLSKVIHEDLKTAYDGPDGNHITHWRALVRRPNGNQFLVCSDSSTDRVYFIRVSDTAKTCSEAHESISGGISDNDIVMSS